MPAKPRDGLTNAGPCSMEICGQGPDLCFLPLFRFPLFRRARKLQGALMPWFHVQLLHAILLQFLQGLPK